MKLLEIVPMTDIKDHKQIWAMSFSIKKQDQE